MGLHFTSTDFDSAIPTMIPQSPTASDDVSIIKHKESGKSKEVRLPFPLKVYDMLEDSDLQGFQEVVSWNSLGTGFMVHDKNRFINDIVPRYFAQTKYKSFQRQLSLYGFQRIATGKSKGLRYHDKLRRGSRQLCREMKPVGYKPRGLEAKRENQPPKPVKAPKTTPKVVMSSVTHVVEPSSSNPQVCQSIQNLPAVVSSNSLYKEEKREVPCAVSPELSPIKTYNDMVIASRNLITPGDIGFFEGMPFYLMSASQPSTPPTKDVAPAVLVDGQLKKAWEIGFQVAMTMKSSSFTAVMDTSSAAAVDALDIHTANLTVV